MTVCGILVAALVLAGPGVAPGEPVELLADGDDLSALDLEQLREIPVTSVAGVAQPLQDTPAALFVVTPEDLRRGGHTTVPDALRAVPGIDVAQVGSNIWAISARGFNDRFSTKRTTMKLKEWEQTQMLATLQRIASMMDCEGIDAAPVLSGDQAGSASGEAAQFPEQTGATEAEFAPAHLRRESILVGDEPNEREQPESS